MATTSSAKFTNVRFGGKASLSKPVLSKSLYERVGSDKRGAANINRGLNFKLEAVHKVTLITPNGEIVFDCPDDTFIVDAAEDLGYEVPYSCRAGTCSTCAGKILKGKVDQSEGSFLTLEQIKEGYVLTCVAYPQTDVRIETEKEEELY